jgi:flagellar hook assembly protein FlgD
MRQTQVTPNQLHNRRRATTGNTLTFGRFASSVGIVAVLVLLGVTFLGDYLRVPTLEVSAAPRVISPNADQTQDVTSVNYILSDAAPVTVQVLTANGVPIRTLSQVPSQAPGQYIVTWNGRDADNVVVNDGTYQIQVLAEGTARNVEQAVEVAVDVNPPPLRLTNLDDLSRVSSPNLVIEGVTEPGATVYQAGNAEVVAVDSQGVFRIERQLTEGTNILEIIASDQAGNTTRTSHEVALITQPPDVTLTRPANDSWFNQPVVEVAGVAPGAALITVNNQPVRTANDGTFEHELILQEGDNTIRVEVTDDVGNVTTRERIVHLRTAPPEIALNIEDGAVFQQATIQLTGRTNPGATVLVNNQVVAVSTLGEFQTSLNLLNGVNAINVEARDIAGNVAAVSRQVRFESPVAPNETTQFLNSLPSLSSLATPLLILIPSILLLGYLFTRPISLQLSADAENFTPGLPNEGPVMNLVLELSRDARASVEVLNEFRRPVATIVHRRQRHTGEHVFQWDGYDDYGNVLPPGEYLIQATASTPGATVQSTVPIYLHEDPLVHHSYVKDSSQTVEMTPATRRAVRRARRS